MSVVVARPPLRAVILDNDETTGSYGLLFAYLSVLEQVPDLNEDVLTYILQRLANWMIVHAVFRPGLRSLLRCLLALRRQKKLDAILMYTNQYDSGTRFSVPRAIACMMNHLAGEVVFDHILTRPDHPEQDGQYRKQFYKILDLFPGVPRDIRQVTFMDDHAVPDFIGHYGIPSSATDESSWYKIEPYSRALTVKDIHESILYCLYGPFGDEVDGLVDPILQIYIQFIPEKLSIPSAKPFIDAVIKLMKKYGYVSKVLLTNTKNNLNPEPSVLPDK
jgi:hypothetical protein